MMIVKVDAARQIDGTSSAGAIVIENGQQQPYKTRLPITPDNHTAEFLALHWVLSTVLLDYPAQTLHIMTDAKIVADALDKHYAKHYQAYVDELLPLLQRYPLVLHDWVREKDNRGAHQLALQALKNI